MKIFFDSKTTETGAKTPETSTTTPEKTKTPEQILTQDLKISKNYLTDYQKFLDQKWDINKLKIAIQNIRDNKIEFLRIDQNWNIQGKNEKNEWINIDTKNITFQSLIKNTEKYLEEINWADEDKENERKILKAFKENDYEKVLELLNLDTAKKWWLIDNLKKATEQNKTMIENWAKAKNINIDTESKNNLIWTTSLLFCLSLRKDILKLTQAKKSSDPKNQTATSFDDEKYTTYYNPILDFVEKNWWKWLSPDSILFSSPMIAAEKIWEKNSIFDAKFSLDKTLQDFLSKKTNQLTAEENHGFSALAKKFKDAIEMNWSPIWQQLADWINAFKNLWKSTVESILWNWQFQSIINQSSDLKKWLEWLWDNSFFKIIFQFLWFWSLSEALNSKQEWFFTRTFLTSLQSLENPIFENSKSIFWNIKIEDLKKAELEKTTDWKSNILISSWNLAFLQSFEPKIWTEEDKIKQFVPKMLNWEKVKVWDMTFSKFYTDMQNLLNANSFLWQGEKNTLLQSGFWKNSSLTEKDKDWKIIVKTSNLNFVLEFMQDFSENIKKDPKINFESWSKWSLTNYLKKIAQAAQQSATPTAPNTDSKQTNTWTTTPATTQAPAQQPTTPASTTTWAATPTAW